VFCRIAVDAFVGRVGAGGALLACWQVAWVISSGVGHSADAAGEVLLFASILRVSELLALVALSPVGELMVAVDFAVIVGDGEFADPKAFQSH
jgi:hypothetical protein